MRGEEFGGTFRRNDCYRTRLTVSTGTYRDKDGLARGKGETFGSGLDSAVAFETDKYKE